MATSGMKWRRHNEEFKGKAIQVVIAMLLAVVACAVGWYVHAESRKSQFLDRLQLVSFSTSKIAMPREDQERAVHERVNELDIDLLHAYKCNLERDVRFDLAWLLITNESTEYYHYANQNIHAVSWPEVRIWTVRRNQETLSPEYRKKLLDLLLASPTSEAKLVAARWYRKQGKITESEDACHAAMKNGRFWDALNAADHLLKSERYRNDAVEHLLSVVRDSDHFVARAAFLILTLYDSCEEFEPLVDSCEGEPKRGKNRKLLVHKLTQLINKGAGNSRSETHSL